MLTKRFRSTSSILRTAKIDRIVCVQETESLTPMGNGLAIQTVQRRTILCGSDDPATLRTESVVLGSRGPASCSHKQQDTSSL
jgi:hypothetical protein